MSNKETKITVIIAIVIACLVGLVTCGSDSGSTGSSDDGYLGYSDGFWEWYLENN
ncbi:MAG: hypothetical protein IJ012_05695 [Clostridia bacterium]|nr:hypothetical protein [Clostridia bacterium]